MPSIFDRIIAAIAPEQLAAILSRLDRVDQGQVALQQHLAAFHGDVMAKLEQFTAALEAVDAETTRIGDYIQELLKQLNRTDLTEAQEATVLAGLAAAAERLKGVGVSVETPVPTEPLPELPV